MNDRPTDADRRAMIATEYVGVLGPDEGAELALLADLLADPSTWAEPRADLEDEVVFAIAGAPALVPSAPARLRRRRLLAGLAAAATVAIVFGTVVVARESTGADFKAQLTATGVVPGARASAEITRNNAGFRVQLDAHGLPALRAGEYYQAWLKNASGSLVPIGTFSSSDGRVTLWSGVSPKNTMLSVTVESMDNNQTSSGRRVISGVVRGG